MKGLQKWSQTLLGVLVLVAAPVTPRWELLYSWPMIIMIIAGALVHLNAPETPYANLVHPNPYDRGSTYLMIFSTSLFSVLSVLDFSRWSLPHPPFIHHWTFSGIVLIFIGLFVRWWTIRTLGIYFTARVNIEEKHEVINIGPYKFLKIRHPAYLGTLLIVLGIPFVLRSFIGLGIAVGIVVPVYLYRISVEEEALQKKMGEAYVGFSKETNRLIPKIF